MRNNKQMFSFIALSAIVLNGVVLNSSFAEENTSTGASNSGAITISTKTTSSTGTVSDTGVVETMSGGAVSNSSVASILGMDYLDESTINVKLSGVTSVDSANSEIKLLNNLKATTKDTTNTKKLILSSPVSLVPGASYSFVSTNTTLDANMDFVYSGEKELSNTMTGGTNYIVKAVFRDDKNIELEFASDLKEEKVEYQLLKEIGVSEVVFNVDTLSIKTKEPLVSNSDYILMLSLKDSMGTDIELDNDSIMKEFTTPEFSVPAAVESKVPEVVNTNDSMSGAIEAGSGNLVENVATQTKTTPDTGAETTVIIILAIILGLGFIYGINRKKA